MVELGPWWDSSLFIQSCAQIHVRGVQRSDWSKAPSARKVLFSLITRWWRGSAVVCFHLLHNLTYISGRKTFHPAVNEIRKTSQEKVCPLPITLGLIVSPTVSDRLGASISRRNSPFLKSCGLRRRLPPPRRPSDLVCSSYTLLIIYNICPPMKFPVP